MYCRKCGKFLEENAEICPLCGTSTSFSSETLEQNKEYHYHNNIPKFDNSSLNKTVVDSKNYTDITTTYSNKLAVIGFILAFLIPLAGLILCIFGSKDSEKLNGEGKSLSIVGIVISVCVFVFSFIFMTIMLVGIASGV